MIYQIDFLIGAQQGLERLHKAGEFKVLKKITLLLEELKIHPKTGKGKPKRARQIPGNVWSRRITRKHRLVYEIFESIVTIEIIQTDGHYHDK